MYRVYKKTSCGINIIFLNITLPTNTFYSLTTWALSQNIQLFGIGPMLWGTGPIWMGPVLPQHIKFSFVCYLLILDPSSRQKCLLHDFKVIRRIRHRLVWECYKDIRDVGFIIKTFVSSSLFCACNE